jgi:hypothetical protein
MVGPVRLRKIWCQNKKFWEELIAYFFYTTRIAQETTAPTFCFAVGTSPSCYLATIGWYTERPTDSTFIRHWPHRKWQVQQFFNCCMCIPCRGNVFTEPLPYTEWRDIHTDTRIDGRDLWNTRLRWAQVPWYIYLFYKDWFRHSKFDGGDSQIHRQHGNLISLLSYFAK